MRGKTHRSRRHRRLRHDHPTRAGGRVPGGPRTPGRGDAGAEPWTGRAPLARSPAGQAAHARRRAAWTDAPWPCSSPPTASTTCSGKSSRTWRPERAWFPTATCCPRWPIRPRRPTAPGSRRLARGIPAPDLTILLDVPVEVAAAAPRGCRPAGRALRRRLLPGQGGGELSRARARAAGRWSSSTATGSKDEVTAAVCRAIAALFASAQEP